ADDAPLHVVAGNIDRADGGVGGVLSGVALDRGGQNLAGLLFAFAPISFFVLLNSTGDLGGPFTLDPFEKHLLGLLARHSRQFVKSLDLLLDQRLQLARALFDMFFTFRELFLGMFERPLLFRLQLVLLLDGVLALFDAAFLFAQFRPGRFHFA